MSLLIKIHDQLELQNDIKGTIDQKMLPQFILDPTQHSPSQNQMLIQNDCDEVFIGLQLDEKIIQLSQSPLDAINVSILLSHNMAVLIEELSHLLYSHYHLERSQPISQLELEVQGEIDRFLSLYFLSRSIHQPLPVKLLHNFLFENPKFHDHIENNIVLKNRYQEAHRLAHLATKKLTPWLEKTPEKSLELGQDLFRRNGHSKFHLIETLKAA